MNPGPEPNERIAHVAERTAGVLARGVGRATGLHHWGGRSAARVAASLRQEIERGDQPFLVGLNLGPHDAGAALVQVGEGERLKIISSYEEERFSRVRQDGSPPLQSLRAVLRDLEELGHGPEAIAAFSGAFDYSAAIASGVRELVRWAPASLLYYFRSGFYGSQNLEIPLVFFRTKKLLRSLGLGRIPVLGMPHHGNHAYLAWALSPWGQESERTGVLVLDGSGDMGSMSAFVAGNGRLEHVESNRDFWSSAGHFYGVLSSALGGWPPGASEGRWMAAAAYGRGSRSENPYYPTMRRILHFEAGGQFRCNWEFANWQVAGLLKPFTPALEAVLGRAIPPALYRSEGLKLDFDPEHMGPGDRRRADVAAATQMVFEDLLQHVLQGLSERYGTRRWVLTGGTALNCVANEKLARDYEIWVPPIPADDGTAMGSAFQLGLRCGARVGAPVRHVFLGCRGPDRESVESSVSHFPAIRVEKANKVASREACVSIAEEIIDRVGAGQLVGLVFGRAECGRRALGHRSILGDPRNPVTRDRMNAAKLRELYRPVAPMVDVEAAVRLFEIDENLEALATSPHRWMGFAAKARPAAFQVLPAVVHRNGTSRIQLVDEDDDPILVALLAAARRQWGVGAIANTSLNVATPLAGRTVDAVRVLAETSALDVLVLVDGDEAWFLTKSPEEAETYSVAQ